MNWTILDVKAHIKGKIIPFNRFYSVYCAETDAMCEPVVFCVLLSEEECVTDPTHRRIEGQKPLHSWSDTITHNAILKTSTQACSLSPPNTHITQHNTTHTLHSTTHTLQPEVQE